MTKVAIIIKTFNEEINVSRAIESSLRAVKPHDGEVIVADSASTDRTIELAMHFPVTVVQIARPNERCCGIGPQLGYQYSNANYVYVLDGDMELDVGFVGRAIDFLDHEPSVAGVGGYVREVRITNLEFEARVRRQRKRQPQDQGVDVECLVGGGLYRRAAIEQVGYLSDKNLRAFEEYDLGVRLRRKGWRLVRLPDHAADHYSHEMDTSHLLLHRVRTGYIFGIGDLLRAAISRGYVKTLFREHRAADLAVGVWLYWCAVLFGAFLLAPTFSWVLIVILSALAAPVAAMTLRLRSLKLGFFSPLSWHASALGLLLGFVRSPTPPTERIQTRVFKTARGYSSSLEDTPKAG